MKTKTLLYLLCFSMLTGACRRKQIPLEIVRHVPGYIENYGLFGEDIKAMEERNAFILETGKIDTTDEYPPTKIAMITIDKHLVQLQHIEYTDNEKESTDAYFGNGYTLLLTFKKAELPVTGIYSKAYVKISRGNKKSEYTLFYKKGYS